MKLSCVPMKFSLLFVAVFASLLLAFAKGEDVCASSSAENPITHFFVLMMENRSFDHFLGWLKSDNNDIIGLTGNEYNLVNPDDSSSQKVFVNDLAELVDPDFDHSVPGTSQEIQWGSQNDEIKDVLLNGFVAQNNIHTSQGSLSLSMFNKTSLPVLSTLAVNFANFDQYFADLPGPTMPNRFFFMSGTSHGLVDNNKEKIGYGLPQKSIFNVLDNVNVSWRVYAETIPTILGLLRVRNPDNLEKMRPMEEFWLDVKEEKLKTFTWLEPSYFGIPELDIVPRDQHPDHPVEYGEELIKKVYESIRQSPYWNCSALVITYDEHGGFADFSPMQTENVPPPDGHVSKNPSFNFDRLGLRVPFVIASPWIDPQVVHTPDPSVRPESNSQFSHSSLAATIRGVFDPNSVPLTNRTAWSAPFDYVWRQRSSPRTDAPYTLPPIHQTAFYKNKPQNPSAHLRMNSLQLELMEIARRLCLDNQDSCHFPVPSLEEVSKMTEAQGGLFAMNVMNALRSPRG